MFLLFCFFCWERGGPGDFLFLNCKGVVALGLVWELLFLGVKSLFFVAGGETFCSYFSFLFFFGKARGWVLLGHLGEVWFGVVFVFEKQGGWVRVCGGWMGNSRS